MPARPLWFLPLVPACVSETTVFEQSLPADEVHDVFCDLERGDFVYSGSSPGTFDVAVAAWARGTSHDRALARSTTNEWGVTRSDTLLDLWGRSPEPRTGIDLTVEGPPNQSIEVVVLDGTAQLLDVTGTHTVTADAIRGRGVAGSADLYATTGGVELQAFPEPGHTVNIESFGPVVLELPYGAEIDLEVFADPDWGAEVTDLGFDELVTAPDYVHAVTGSGAIPIRVVVTGGAFTLWNADL